MARLCVHDLSMISEISHYLYLQGSHMLVHATANCRNLATDDRAPIVLATTYQGV